MSMTDLIRSAPKILWAIWKIVFGYARGHPWAVVVALYGLARAFGVVIQSGQRGVLFRWGRAAKELEPGFHWLVPVVHGVKSTHVRSVTLDLPGQKVMTADGLIYDVGVNLVYRVEDATKALTLIDHVEAGCRTAVPIVVTEVIRVRDQAQLVDRVSLDRELSMRVHDRVARWGLVVEQAGFTSIAPNKGVLRTTQLRSRTVERARALRLLMDGGLDAGSALVMIGAEQRPVGKSGRRYRAGARRSGLTSGPARRKSPDWASKLAGSAKAAAPQAPDPGASRKP